MREVQPTWMGPLIQSDGRLGQALRFSVSDSSSTGAHPIVYGNNHGVSAVVGRRFQFDFDPPSYFRNHSSALHDGFGNAAAQIKYRVASGNSEHGNYVFTAILDHAFAPRAYQNGSLTSVECPKIAVGRAFRGIAALSTLGGILPAAKIAEQGRGIEWNLTAQIHPSAHTWFDIENNALFNRGGPDDGKIQNFITPAAFYMVRRKAWKPTHASIVFDGGMQIATSSFHFYNHNLITEMRIFY